MKWFKNYLRKYSFSWMHRFLDGRRYWQLSLDTAMSEGLQRWNSSPENKSGDKLATTAIKKKIFFEWIKKVPVSISKLKDQIDNYMEETEGFRPFETKIIEDNPTKTPNVEELEQWFA